MSAKSTRFSRRNLSAKPKAPAGSPIWPNPAGYWCKKISGKVVYFGQWRKQVDGEYQTLPNNGGYKDALAKYEAEITGVRQDIEVGRKPRSGLNYVNDIDTITTAHLCNLFLSSMLTKAGAGDKSLRTFADYKDTTAIIVQKFGRDRLVASLEPEDFATLYAAIPETWGVIRRVKFVATTKTVFKYAKTNNKISNDVAFGSDFKAPSKRAVRLNKNEGPKKMFSADELRLVLDALEGKQVTIKRAGRSAKVTLKANPQLRTIVLLGINGGLGNTDAAKMQRSHLKQKWVDYPRPKTGVQRRFPLWPETVKAIDLHLKSNRAAAKSPEDANCIFLSKAGTRLVQENITEVRDDEGNLLQVKPWNQDHITKQFDRVLKELEIKRSGVGFYSLRHTFTTVGRRCGDEHALRMITGHTAENILDEYDEEGPENERIQRITDYVRGWLYGPAPTKARKSK